MYINFNSSCQIDSSAGTNLTKICREGGVITGFFKFKNLCGNKNCLNILHHRLVIDEGRCKKSEEQMNAMELAEILEPFWYKALSMGTIEFVEWYNTKIARAEYEKIRVGELRESYKFMNIDRR